MKATTYLYGVEPTEFVNLPYGEALLYKLAAGKRLVYELIEEHYSSRDDIRINAIGKADKHNRALLEEVNMHHLIK